MTRDCARICKRTRQYHADHADRPHRHGRPPRCACPCFSRRPDCRAIIAQCRRSVLGAGKGDLARGWRQGAKRPGFWRNRAGFARFKARLVSVGRKGFGFQLQTMPIICTGAARRPRFLHRTAWRDPNRTRPAGPHVVMSTQVYNSH